MRQLPVVLIIEDDIIFDKIFREFLEGKVEILWGHTGEEAIGLFLDHRNEIQVISCDGTVAMRDMTELITLFRREDKGNYRGVILAASGSEEHSERMVAAGANRAVRKDKVPEEILIELGLFN